VSVNAPGGMRAGTGIAFSAPLAARCSAARINYKVYASKHERVARGVGVYVRSSPWDERERTTREQNLTTRSNKCCSRQPCDSDLSSRPL